VPPELITLLAAAASAVVGTAGEKLSDGVLKHLASGVGSIWSSILTSRLERAADARELEARLQRNHDLHDLSGRAITFVIDELKLELVNHGYLRATLLEVRAGFDTGWPSIDASVVPAEVAGVVATVTSGAGEQPSPSSLSPEQWSVLLARVSGVRADQTNEELFRRLGVKLHANYERALLAVAARSWKERDFAWPKLVLGILGDISRMNAETRQDVKEVQEACLRISTALTDHIKAATRSLGDYLYRPWERPNTFPFHFSLRQTTVVGAPAAEALARLDGFLDDNESFAWWLWTGLEGAGKSRCAAEVCRAAEQRVWLNGTRWRAGFVEWGDLTRLANTWATMLVDAPTLLVLDYVGSAPDEVRSALVGLARRPDAATPVRVLLLERHTEALRTTPDGSIRPEWVDRIFGPELDRLASEKVAERQYPHPGAPSLHLGGLSPEEAEQVALELLSREAPESPLAARVAVARETVRIIADQPRPLHVQITALVLWQSHDVRPASFADVMRRYVRGRLAYRRRQLTALVGDEADRVLNLMCLATLLRRVSLPTIEALVRAPGATWASRLPSPEVLARRGRLLTAFGQSPDATDLNGLEPDLIGEWFVRLWSDDGDLDTTLDSAVITEMARAVPGSSRGIQDFVQRTYRYFSDTTLWRRLRNTLGRYSTPFGRAFDQRQSMLLGGTSRRADTWYSAAIHRHIDAVREESVRRHAVVIDLMAGGSARPDALCRRFGRGLTLIAIDRDVSRLAELPVGAWGSREPGLRVVEQEVTARLDLRAVLDQACSRQTCDMVIAKKALHELKWEEQQALIERIGQVVHPGGYAVIYADSPVLMDSRGQERWWDIQKMLQRLLPIDLPASEDLAERTRAFLPEALPFSAASPSDPAVFANLWIKLKDWANYNSHEYEHRYFSSMNELLDEFTLAGFETPGHKGASPQTRVQAFAMELQATRFVEEAINRLGYLAVDRQSTPDELAAVFHDNTRYQLFWAVAEAHLWSVGGPTAFGASEAVGAKAPSPFAVRDLLEFLGDESLKARLDLANLPPLQSPSFRMPVHVLVLRKSF